MALETVVYSQDPFSYGCSKDFYPLVGSSNWGYDFCLQEEEEEEHKSLIGIFDNHIMDQNFHANWDKHYYYTTPNSLLYHNHVKDLGSPYSSSPETNTVVVDNQSPPRSALQLPDPAAEPPATAAGRRKRRRTRSCKNKEELENQRMTHIAVERNRRKQMNEYLAVLRSLMPASYVQRGDQASIIGGAINFVKELEQLLQSMGGCNMRTKPKEDDDYKSTSGAGGRAFSQASSPLAEFFTFPQYSTRATSSAHQYSNSSSGMSLENYNTNNNDNNNNKESSINMSAQNSSDINNQWAAAADIEVTMVDSHANLKILSKKRPRQLLKMVAGLQALRLSVLHLNVTTVDQMVLYSVSVKIEEGCQLNTVDEIAAAVNQMLRRIQEEPAFS